MVHVASRCVVGRQGTNKAMSTECQLSTHCSNRKEGCRKEGSMCREGRQGGKGSGGKVSAGKAQQAGMCVSVQGGSGRPREGGGG